MKGNFKVRATRTLRWYYTKDKIYEFIDGNASLNGNYVLLGCMSFKHFQYLYVAAEDFEEVKDDQK